MVRENKTVLVVEKLFEEFKEAADSLKQMTEKQNSLDKKKTEQKYMGIKIVTAENSDPIHSYPVSGTVETFIVTGNLEELTYQTVKKTKKAKRKK